MLKATIYQLPPQLAGLDGRAAAHKLTERAAASGCWEHFNPNHPAARLVPSGTSRTDGVPLEGTSILYVHVDTERKRVHLREGTQLSAKGGRRGRAPGTHERISRIKRLVGDLGLIEPAAETLPTVHSHRFTAQVQTAGGGCGADGITRQVRSRGFLEGPNTLQLVVTEATGHAGAAQTLRQRLADAASRGCIGPAGRVEVYGKGMPAAEALGLLQSDSGSGRRGRTVLVYALPDEQIELGHPSLRELQALQGYGVPVLAALAEGNDFGTEGLVFKAWLARGGLPYRVEHDFGADFLIGADAAHSHGSGSSRWSVVLLDHAGRIIGADSHEGQLDESWRAGVAQKPLRAMLELAAEGGAKRVVLHRDGRKHAADWDSVRELADRVGVDVEFVPVAKRAEVLLYRENGGVIEPPRFGDALVERDGTGAWAFTAYGSKAAEAGAVRVHGLQNVGMGKALSDVFGASMLPTPGLFMTTRLPATTYWADLLSKRDAGALLKRSGFMDARRRSNPAGAGRQ